METETSESTRTMRQRLYELQKAVDGALRFIVSGGSTVLAFGALMRDGFSFLKVGQETNSSILLLFVVVAGAVLYALHRAIPFPLIVRLLRRLQIRCHRELHSETPEKLRSATAKRARERRSKAGDPKEDRWDLDATASQVHFLYCSAWGCWTALAIVFAHSRSWPTDALLVGVIGFILLAGACRRNLELMDDELRDAGILKDSLVPGNGAQ